jgi:hypothetical protein
LTAHESFQMSVAVVAIVRPSGLSANGNLAAPTIVSVAPATSTILPIRH